MCGINLTAASFANCQMAGTSGLHKDEVLIIVTMFFKSHLLLFLKSHKDLTQLCILLIICMCELVLPATFTEPRVQHPPLGQPY